MNHPLALLGATLGAPLVVAGITVAIRPHSVLGWLLSTFLCVGVAVYVYRASPVWPWLGLGWRHLLLLVPAAAVLWSVRLLPALPVLPPSKPLLLADIALRFAAVALIAGMLVHLQMASLIPAGAIDLPLPLTGGRYMVVQGGGAAGLNRHRSVRAQAYATDIVALNAHGRRAEGMQPEAIGAYEILDRAVIAPCDGVVLGSSDGTPDDAPPVGSGDIRGLVGNYVLLLCVSGSTEITILLAHLRFGSVAVNQGDLVRRGATLGRVGSSGNSTEPHLHIHAVRGREADLEAVIATAEPVPLTFNGRFLVRNAVIRVFDLP